MIFSLVVDVMIMILLGAAIVYVLRLNKQITLLYATRGDLETFIEGFTTSLNKAEVSMAALRNTGETTFSAVNQALTQAQVLKDDLSYLVERGEDIASHLDEAIRTARSLQKEVSSLSKNDEEKTALMSHLRSVR